MGLFEELRDEMDRLWHYDSSMADLTQRAADNTAFYTEKGNAYLAALNRKIANTYQDRRVTAYYSTWGLTQYLKYDFSTLMLLILMIPLLAPLFAGEHENGMHALLRLTQHAKQLPFCKLAAGAIAVCAVTALFLAEDFLMFSVLYHIRGLSQPVYSLPDFADSPLSCSIGAYLLINAAAKLLGFLVLGGFCAAFSAFTKRELTPFCISFAVLLCLVLADTFLENPVLAQCSPVTLLSAGKLFRDFQVIRIADRPISAYLLPLAFSVPELCLPVCAVIGRCRRER